eukprot:1145675-Pelagomonas_calceolata.AAC.1
MALVLETSDGRARAGPICCLIYITLALKHALGWKRGLGNSQKGLFWGSFAKCLTLLNQPYAAYSQRAGMPRGSKKPALQPHLLYFADDSPSRSNGLQLAVPVVG